MPDAQAYFVLGMHRSGTSLVSRLLNLMGVDLGPEERLMGPKPDNPSGFWEHEPLTALNDEILGRFGGSWDAPPVLPSGWERSRDLADLRRKASGLIREDFGRSAVWGWKDPRSSLTLPFWQRLLPGMRYVLCLRNPVDVAGSLTDRNEFPPERGFELWLTYVASALGHTAGAPRILLFYEDFMSDWRGEMRRLAEFAGRSSAAEAADVQRAAEDFVSRDLQHHTALPVEIVSDETVPFPARALYLVLRLYVDRAREGTADPGLEAALEAFARAASRAS